MCVCVSVSYLGVVMSPVRVGLFVCPAETETRFPHQNKPPPLVREVGRVTSKFRLCGLTFHSSTVFYKDTVWKIINNFSFTMSKIK